MNYQDATKMCNSMDAYLVEPKSQQETENLREFREELEGSRVWIGLLDVTKTRRFVWAHSNETTEGYDNWVPGCPDNYYKNEFCVATIYPSHDFLWNDVPCDFTYNVMCQREQVGCKQNKWELFIKSKYKVQIYTIVNTRYISVSTPFLGHFKPKYTLAQSCILLLGRF